LGKHEDGSGLTHLEHRDYDPTTGVFITVDPLVATTGDPYNYAAGNPTTLSDPNGLCAGREGTIGGCGIDYYGGGGYSYAKIYSGLYCGQGTHGLAGGDCNTYGSGITNYTSLGACGSDCDDLTQDRLTADFGVNDRDTRRGGWAALGIGLAAFLALPHVMLTAETCLAAPAVCAAAASGPGTKIAHAGAEMANGAPTSPSPDDILAVTRTGAIATNTADDLLALPGARQVDAAWGVNTYRQGGTMSTIEHINYRHAWNSGFEDVSRFADGTSARQIQGLVDDALRYGNVTTSGNTTSIVWNTGVNIGVDTAGSTVSGIQVYVRDGIIQTAFPVAAPG
jgi:RHS repeat-associated protein